MPNGPPQDGSETGPTRPEDGSESIESKLRRVLEVVARGDKLSIGVIKARLKIGYDKAKRLMVLLEERGVVGGAANGRGEREVLLSTLPAEAGGSVGTARTGTSSSPADASSALVDGVPPAAPALSGETLPPAGDSVPAAKASGGGAAGGGSGGAVRPTTAIELVRRFYAGCALREEDDDRLGVKRGLESRTTRALGLVSGVRGNKDVLERLAAGNLDPHPGPLPSDERGGIPHPGPLPSDGRGGMEVEEELLLESGLWVARKGQGLKPNGQFFGAGRIRELKAGEGPGRGEWASEEGEEHGKKRKRWLWGWTEPVLIPYRNAAGELVGLRPHKGSAPGGTECGRPRLYVPRLGSGGWGPGSGREARLEERFQELVLTEGELKAGALWQEIGLGRQDGRKPWGVAGVPGINFANHEPFSKPRKG